MSGRGRLAVCATAATLLAALSLLPLAAPMGWFGEAVVLVLVQAGVGAAVRRAPVARPVTVAVQALVTLLLLTLAFAPDQAVLGMLPGPAAVQRLGQLLSQGVSDVGQYAIPAPVTPGIKLLLIGGVLLVALVVDLLAVTYVNAAPAGLPLLALYSVASGLSGPGEARWLWFLLAALGYLLLLLAEGRDRLSRWGRVFSGTPRRSPFASEPLPGGGESSGQPLAAVRSGRRIGVLALGIALLVPAVLPAMGAGLLVPGSSGGGLAHGGGTISAVNPLVSLQSSLNQPDDRVVLRYSTTAQDSSDMYLRIVTLDQFDGTTWKASTRKVVNVPDTLPAPQGLSPGVKVARIDTAINAAAGYAQNYLPMPYPATRVGIHGDWRYEPAGRTLVGDHGQTTAGERYQVESLEVDPTAQQLEDAPPAPAAILAEYTKVPGTLPPLVKRLAEQVTHGARNQYQEAVKLQDYFTTTGGFTYDTTVAEGSGPDAIVRFLHDKRGFCVHFAFTMAAMARTLGIPARVDVGFVPGTQQADNTWTVGLRDAHAWPELYFQGIGWTRFEPTPSRGFAPDYTLDPAATGSGNDLPAPHIGAGGRPTGGPSASATCDQVTRRIDGCSAGNGLTVGAPPGSGGPGAGPITGAAVLFLLLVLALVPMAWRLRIRAVRLGGGRFAAGRAARSPAPPGDDPEGDGSGSDGSGGDAFVAGRTLAAWRELLDSAWDYGLAPDTSETPRRATARLVEAARLTGAPAEAARRVGGAVEQTLYARHPAPAPGLADDVRQVRRALHDRADPRTRLRALLAPRSFARVRWAARSRWDGLRQRGGRAVSRVTGAAAGAAAGVRGAKP